MEDEEEFEVLKLDDGWEHAERCNLPQTAARDVKNRSYKVHDQYPASSSLLLCLTKKLELEI